MGRLVAVLADIVALARLAVEGRDLWREYRRDGAPEGADGRGDRERPDQQEPPEPRGAIEQGGP